MNQGCTELSVAQVEGGGCEYARCGSNSVVKKGMHTMKAFRTETVLHQNGVLIVRGVPFCAGEKVEVIILSPPLQRAGGYPLRGKPIRYIAPFDSVAHNDWDALQ